VRYLSIAFCALAVATSAAPAAALNPQPLPPGIYVYTPPDPCVTAYGRRAHARCVARYHSTIHSHGSGAGAGKIR